MTTAKTMALLTALAMALASGAAHAAVPASVLAQGVLHAKGGGPVADGIYDVTFALYAAKSGGAAFWSETVKLTLTKGEFSHVLGSSKPLVAASLDKKEVWLGAKVGGEPELPRKQVHAGAFALRAAIAEAAAFTYAGSKTKGGPANDLQCTGCVGVSELKIDGDLDLGGNALKAKTVVAGSFIGDGSKLTGIGAPSGSCKNKGEVVKGINPDGSLVCVKAMDASNLPPDGLDEVSNGLMSTQFVDEVFGHKDVPVADNNPTGTNDSLDFPDVGIAEKLDVLVDVSNSNIAQVTIWLFDPANTKYVLYNKGGKGGTVKGVWPSQTKTISGDLTKWVGKNPKGKWRLQVIDTGFKNNTFDGKINNWSVRVQTLSSKKVQVKGTLVDASGKPMGRVMTANANALKHNQSLTLKVGVSTPGVIAQAWFWEESTKQWVQANAGSAAASGCTACGSGADGDYKPTKSANLTAKLYNFKNVLIPKGVNITVTGSNPLQIKAAGKIEIYGALLLDGGVGPNVQPNKYGCSGNNGSSVPGMGGPGGGNGGKGQYGQSGTKGSGIGGGGGGNNSSYGSGGGGGGYGSGGATAQKGSSGVSPGQGGSTYGGIVGGQLVGGSGGGGGGYGAAYNSGGAGGGGGGGAVKLEAQEITIGGKISANGGRGAHMTNNCDGGAGGGGSGGAIWIRGGKVNLIGNTITALGGGKGDAYQQHSSDGGDGGAGGQGRVRIDSSTPFNGNTNPAYGAGATTGLTPPVQNKFRIDQKPAGTVVLTNQTGKTVKVWLVATF